MVLRWHVRDTRRRLGKASFVDYDHALSSPNILNAVEIRVAFRASSMIPCNLFFYFFCVSVWGKGARVLWAIFATLVSGRRVRSGRTVGVIARTED